MATKKKSCLRHFPIVFTFQTVQLLYCQTNKILWFNRVLLDVIIWELDAQINYYIETISLVLYSSNLSSHRHGTSKVALSYHQEQAAEIFKSQGYRMGRATLSNY